MNSNIKSHFHITLANVTSDNLQEAAKLVKCKPTNIDLIMKEKEYRDRMITGYQMGIDENKLINNKNILEDSGFEVSRIKLEADLLDYIQYLGKPDFSKFYVEAHFHISKKEDVDCKIFSFSKNPSSNGKIFANYRAYNAEDMEFIINFTKGMDNTHLELCIFDSNVGHDIFWWNDR